MQYFRLKVPIDRNGLLFEVFIKTDEDLTNQEIIVLGKRSYCEIKTEKLDPATCDVIQPNEYWKHFDKHFANY